MRCSVKVLHLLKKKGIQGTIGEQIHFNDGDYGLGIYGNIKIHSTSLINSIDKDKKREISAGYTANHEWVSGEFNGQHYDCIQRNIIFNHVALVDAGRMGEQVAILDGNDLPKQQPNQQAKLMAGHIQKLKEAAEHLSAGLAILNEFSGEEVAEVEEGLESDMTGEPEPIADEFEEVVKKEEVDNDDGEESETDKKPVMDSADIQSMINKAVMKAVAGVSQASAERDDLYTKLKATGKVSVMDGIDKMTAKDLAIKAAKQLDIDCPPNEALAAIKGFLAATSKNAVMDESIHVPAHINVKPSLAEFE